LFDFFCLFQMKKGLIAAVLCTCVLFALVGAEGDTKSESKVITLTEKNFDEVIKSHKFTLVKFCSPYDIRCSLLGINFKLAADILAKDDEDFVLAEVDVAENEELAGKYNVGSNSILAFSQDGSFVPYNMADRNRDTIVLFMLARLGIRNIDNDEELEKFLKINADALLVAYTDKESELAKVFSETVEEMAGQKLLFAIARPTDKYTDKVVAYRVFEKEDREEVLKPKDNVPTVEEMKQWFSIVSLPLAGVIASKDRNRYKILPTLIVFTQIDSENDPSSIRYVLNRLRPVAKEFQFRMLFGIQERKDNFLYKTMDFPSDQKYAFAIVDGIKYYRSDDSVISKEVLHAFIEEFFAGTLPRYIRSQPAPWFNYEGEVHTIVGSTFEKLILNTSTDTLLEVYGPNCTDCEEFDPDYDDLASEFNVKGSTVRIAKIDGSSNSFPEAYSFDEYPSFFWVKAFDGEHPLEITFDGKIRKARRFIEYYRADNSTTYGMAPSRSTVQYICIGIGVFFFVLFITLICLCCKKSDAKEKPKKE